MVVTNTMAQQQERNHPRVTPFSILDILGKQRKCAHPVDEEDAADFQRHRHSPHNTYDEQHPRLHEPSLHSPSAKINGELRYHQKTAVDFIQYKHYHHDKIYVNTDRNRPIDDLLKVHQQPPLDMIEKPKDLTYRSIVSPTSSHCEAEVPPRPGSQSSEEEVEETETTSSPLTLTIDKGKKHFSCHLVSKLNFYFFVYNAHDGSLKCPKPIQ